MESKKNVIERAEQTVRERGLSGSDTPVLLMVSGGSDSTALAYIVCELQRRGLAGQLGIMHLNHRLRGDDSDGDARFVELLAEALDVPLYLYSAEIGRMAEESGDNLEALARRERYAAAQDALRKLCLYAGRPESEGRIFTAHTQNDRVENFYMRSIVGTGPGGFRSMLYANGIVGRPLLDVDRDALRDYLTRRDLDARADASVPMARDEAGGIWREDATNDHTDRFRAYVRCEIVPKAQQRNPRLFDVLCRSMNLIADEDDMLDEQACGIFERQVSVAEGQGGRREAFLIAPSFGRQPLPLQRRVAVKLLQRMIGPDARLESASVDALLAAFSEGCPRSGYTANIQGDLAVSANKRGVRVEPMASYRARRKNPDRKRG